MFYRRNMFSSLVVGGRSLPRRPPSVVVYQVFCCMERAVGQRICFRTGAVSRPSPL